MSDGLKAARLARTQAAAAVELEPVALAEEPPPPPPVEDLTATDPVSADLAADAPGNVAILNVNPSRIEDDPAYAVVISCAGRMYAAPPRLRPRVQLGELAQKENRELRHDPSDVLDAVHEWSTENRHVSRWLRERVEADPDLRVLVIDHTGYELPWELLTLFPAGHEDEQRYLGVAMPIARWPQVQDTHTAEPMTPRFEDALVRGRVLAFVDRANLAGGGAEHATLEGLGATSAGSMQELVGTLTPGAEGVGLVYVAAHGHHGQELRDVSIGSGADGVKLARLRRARLRAFRAGGLVVFLNVCHAGRVVHEDRYTYSERLRGFPEVFLGHGARGVIAATGAVDDRYATELANWALARLAAGPEVGAAELLREWRAEVHAALRDDADERAQLRLLTAFMYVYYGNPLTRLRIDA